MTEIQSIKEDIQSIESEGSGKVTSLLRALEHLGKTRGKVLRRDDQKIACITSTYRAANIISENLGASDVHVVSTLHNFLWGEIERFTDDIRSCLINASISDMTDLGDVKRFKHDNTSSVSDYAAGWLSNNDVIALSSQMISQHKVLQSVIGQKYPYLFIDDSQGMPDAVMKAFNAVYAGEGLPVEGAGPVRLFASLAAETGGVNKVIKVTTKHGSSKFGAPVCIIDGKQVDSCDGVKACMRELGWKRADLSKHTGKTVASIDAYIYRGSFVPADVWNVLRDALEARA